jgi:hypothetical protein
MCNTCTICAEAIFSIVGFFAGFSLAASLAAYNLLEEYKLASVALQASVNELQQSTEKVRVIALVVHFCVADNHVSLGDRTHPPD